QPHGGREDPECDQDQAARLARDAIHHWLHRSATPGRTLSAMTRTCARKVAAVFIFLSAWGPTPTPDALAPWRSRVSFTAGRHYGSCHPRGHPLSIIIESRRGLSDPQS